MHALATFDPGLADPGPAHPGLAVMLSHALNPSGWFSEPVVTTEPVADAWSDAALVQAIVKRGSQQHFRTLMARHKTRVHHIALSVLGPGQTAAAEDVAQEVFFRLYQRLESFRGDARFTTWLYRMAFNQAIDHQRRNQRHFASSLDAVPEPAAPEHFEDHNRSEAIRTAVFSLPQTQRIIVHLFYWLGLKVREISEVLDCPENTVKVYLSRARIKLAAELELMADE